MRIFKHFAKQQVTTYNCSCSTFPMITMYSHHFLRVIIEELAYLSTYDEKCLKKGSLMIFPFNVKDIYKLLLINFPSAKINNKIFTAVLLDEKLLDLIDRISINFL